MKRAVYIILLAFFCLPAFVTGVLAGDALVDTGIITESLPYDVRQSIGDISPDSTDTETGIKALLQSALNALKNTMKSASLSGFSILAVCALTSVLIAFSKSSGLDISSKITDAVQVCAMTVIALTSGGNVLSDCASAIERLGGFSKVLMPVFGAAAAVSGTPATAAMISGGAVAFSSLIIELAISIFIPLIYLYIIASAAGILSENDTLTKGADFVRWISVFFFKGFVMIFTAYVSLTGLVSGASDAMLIKTARVTISGVVPVLGSTIADASEALLNGAALLRASIGVYGFLGACAICLAPFVAAFAHLLVFKILAVFTASFSSGGGSKMMDRLSNAFGLALGLLGCCCVVLFIALIAATVVSR